MTLDDALQQQYDAISSEIQPFIDSDLYNQGVSRLDTILEGVPADDGHRLFRGALFAKRAELQLELEDDEAAWEDAQKAMNAGWYDASVYSIAGWAMYHMDKLDLALEQFTKAVDSNVDNDTTEKAALLGRAMVYVDQEENDLARTDLSRVLQIDSEHATALAMRAEVSIELGALDSAKADIAKARAIDSTDADYGLLHARLLLLQQDFDGAISALNDSLSDDEPLLDAILLRSHLYFMKGDLKKARRDALRASNTFPDEAIAFVQLAMVQFSMQSNTLAMKAADRAVTLDSSLSDGYYIRSLVFDAIEDEEKAEKDRKIAAKAPLELPVFLYGPLVDEIDPNQLAASLQKFAAPPAVQQAPSDGNPFAGGIPNIPGLGGLDPTKMLDQIFDSEGNIKPTFKPILRMALKNAPGMMQSVPDSMLKKMGNIDKEQLENFDPSQLSEEEIEQQMKLFYKMVKAGKNPLDPRMNLFNIWLGGVGSVVGLMCVCFVLSCGTPRVDPGFDLVNMEAEPDMPSVDLLLNPELQPTKPAPNTFRVEVDTSKGKFTLEISREWSPNGVDRFHYLVDIGYFTDVLMYRAIAGFMFQFGIHSEPEVNEVWKDATFSDDPAHPDASNVEGMVTFAASGAPNSRTTQLFINLGNNARLDTTFRPIGRVISGMEVVKSINTEYGENTSGFQPKFQEQGNSYALEIYPNLDRIQSMTIVE